VALLQRAEMKPPAMPNDTGGALRCPARCAAGDGNWAPPEDGRWGGDDDDNGGIDDKPDQDRSPHQDAISSLRSLLPKGREEIESGGTIPRPATQGARQSRWLSK
jgi:hypothetical protein